MWKSLLHHIVDKHKFGKTYPKYKRCSHKVYTRNEARKKKWLTKDSPAYNNLEKVVLDKRNLKDMEQLTNPLHTGSLEVFHSLINCYAPKRLGFELNVQDARIKLAIIDHNNNVGKEQARIWKVKHGSGKEGELRFKYVSSKLSKEWVPKPIMDPKSFSFVFKILEDIVERK